MVWRFVFLDARIVKAKELCPTIIEHASWMRMKWT